MYLQDCGLFAMLELLKLFLKLNFSQPRGFYVSLSLLPTLSIRGNFLSTILALLAQSSYFSLYQLHLQTSSEIASSSMVATDCGQVEWNMLAIHEYRMGTITFFDTLTTCCVYAWHVVQCSLCTVIIKLGIPTMSQVCACNLALTMSAAPLGLDSPEEFSAFEDSNSSETSIFRC